MIDRFADGAGRGFYQDGRTADTHLLADLTHGKRYRNVDVLIDMERDVAALKRLESGSLHLDGIPAAGNERKRVVTLIVCDDGARRSRQFASKPDVGLGNCGPRGVG